jgi:hypothetical protein
MNCCNTKMWPSNSLIRVTIVETVKIKLDIVELGEELLKKISAKFITFVQCINELCTMRCKVLLTLVRICFENFETF